VLYLPKQIHYAVQQEALANKQTVYEWILDAIIEKLKNCKEVVWFYPTCPYCKQPYWVKESVNQPGMMFCKECRKTF